MLRKTVFYTNTYANMKKKQYIDRQRQIDRQIDR